MDDRLGPITIIASSTMVHHRVRCMICDRSVDHRVVFMTNDARVLHAGCVPDHVKVPTPVLLQAIRRLERMVDRARTSDRQTPDPPDPSTALAPDPPAPFETAPEDPTSAAAADPADLANPADAGYPTDPGSGSRERPGR